VSPDVAWDGYIRVWPYEYQLYIKGGQGQGQYLLLELAFANVDMGAGFTDTTGFYISFW
jgi:hypothetical protein